MIKAVLCYKARFQKEEESFKQDSQLKRKKPVFLLQEHLNWSLKIYCFFLCSPSVAYFSSKLIGSS